jgi:hypothetical protein
MSALAALDLADVLRSKANLALCLYAGACLADYLFWSRVGVVDASPTSFSWIPDLTVPSHVIFAGITLALFAWLPNLPDIYFLSVAYAASVVFLDRFAESLPYRNWWALLTAPVAVIVTYASGAALPTRARRAAARPLLVAGVVLLAVGFLTSKGELGSLGFTLAWLLGGLWIIQDSGRLELRLAPVFAILVFFTITAAATDGLGRRLARPGKYASKNERLVRITLLDDANSEPKRAGEGAGPPHGQMPSASPVEQTRPASLATLLPDVAILIGERQGRFWFERPECFSCVFSLPTDHTYVSGLFDPELNLAPWTLIRTEKGEQLRLDRDGVALSPASKSSIARSVQLFAAIDLAAIYAGSYRADHREVPVTVASGKAVVIRGRDGSFLSCEASVGAAATSTSEATAKLGVYFSWETFILRPPPRPAAMGAGTGWELELGPDRRPPERQSGLCLGRRDHRIAAVACDSRQALQFGFVDTTRTQVGTAGTHP